MPRICPVDILSGAGSVRVGELVFADDLNEPSRSAPAMAFQYDDQWLRHGFSLGADLPLVSGIQRPLADPSEGDPVLRSRGARFGFVCDHAPGAWVGRLFELARAPTAYKAARGGRLQAQINDLKVNSSGLGDAAGDLWAASGHLGHRFSALSLPLTLGNQREFSLPLLPSKKPRETAQKVREIAAAFESLAAGRAFRDPRELKLLQNCAVDIGGRTPKALVKLDSPGERVLRLAPPGMPFNPFLVTALARVLASRCAIEVVGAVLVGSLGELEERFDRDCEGRPILALSAATLVRRRRATRAAPLSPAAGWLDVADILNREGAQTSRDLEELFKRLLFNSLIGNSRDRIDQIWFTRVSGGWKLLPMYEPTASAAPAAGAPRQLSTPLRGAARAVSADAVVAAARYFGVKPAQAKALRLEFMRTISDWRREAEALGADFFALNAMAPIFTL